MISNEIVLRITTLAVILVLSAAAAAAAAAAIPESSAQEEKFNEEVCRSWGFDASHLSCSTCELLRESSKLAKLQEQCELCCQAYIANTNEKSSMVYKHIILLTGIFGVPNHVKELLESEEFADLVERKGDAHLQTKQTTDGMMQRQPPQLLLYKKVPKNNIDDIGVDAMIHIADEVIGLNGWKKEDIMDLLRNSLSDSKLY
eukprot:CAMPEP_0195517514 /NCGR_PEP_ID=MMETSP0794_2-20130614/10988_1 /TAXON_ID=515487 /ORGANISM="Stephanopyxis turris, Strain CCMP 815" /LENGTH=201 /DNA_ID=CAMNT_0040646331 /DNA_START=31 /DNA_END=636 /DNA_ORIENTATION=-